MCLQVFSSILFTANDESMPSQCINWRLLSMSLVLWSMVG